MRAIYHEDFNKDKDYFPLHWAVTNNCNFKCNYCGVHKKEKYYDIHNVIEFINFVNEIKNVDAVLFGGEPFIHPNILQIVGELQSNIRICTNLSENIGFLRELIKINTEMRFIASYHHKKIDIMDFYDRVLFLADYSELVKIKVMWESKNKKQIKRIYEFLLPLEDRFDNVQVQLDMVYHPTCKFTNKDIEYFDSVQKDKSFFIINDNSKKQRTSYNEIRRMFNGFPKFYGWQCHCGENGLFIDSDGEVYYCQTKRNKKKGIFNLNTDDFTKYIDILNKPIVCDEDEFCHDVVIPRKRL